jgi:ABC-type hemin transport system ATPase subunit
MQLLKNLTTNGLSVVMVVHDLIVAARADRVALLHNGQMQAIGSPEEVLKIELLERVYQTKLERLSTLDGRMVIIAS